MITVITPSYGYARFLTSALNSVWSSDCAVQHVVIDGASTDGSVEILRAWDRPGFEWRSEPDVGQSDALNKALKLATGDFVGWLNADEFYLPGALEVACSRMSADPRIDVLYGDTVFVDSEGRFVRLLANHPWASRLLSSRGCTLSTASTFLRRSILPEDPFALDCKVVMDWDLFLRLQVVGARFQYVAWPMAAFRVHSDQVTAINMDRDSAEHRRVRRRRSAPVGKWAWRRATGDARHRLGKVASGAWRRERGVKSMLGVEFLDSDGRVNQDAFELLLQLGEYGAGVPL
jgi:glycosyltransferase involved in cell wall biosynthesis